MARVPSIRVKTEGPKSAAQRVRGFMTLFDASVKIEAHNLMRSLASKVRDEVRTVIETQAYNWKPLNPDYKAEKVREGYDPRILIRSKFYWDHIEWWMSATGVHVGVRNIQHPDAKMSLNDLARMHEFGAGNIPARPHWRPAWAKVLNEFPKLRNDYYRRVKKQLEKKAKKR